MAGVTEKARKELGEPLPSTSQDQFKSLRQTGITSIILGKRTNRELNNTEGEGERPSSQELGSGVLRLRKQLRRNSPPDPSNPFTSIEQSGDENTIKAGPPARNDQRGDKNTRHKLRGKDNEDHRLSGNHEGYYKQLHHDDRSRFLKPPALSTAGHYTISKDYTGGKEVRRSHLLEIYGRKCGAKRDGQVFVKQQEEETRKNHLRTPRMDPKMLEPSIPAETNETEQQRRVRMSLQGASTIHKENDSFDIPAGRNLSNIDHLISQSTDEQEIKELKQQKRLLRNRQAALDSIQRKKQDSERLEDEKNEYVALISDMEQQMSQLTRRNEQLLLEKEEMIRSHTMETGELRKKVTILTEHIQRLQNTLS